MKDRGSSPTRRESKVPTHWPKVLVAENDESIRDVLVAVLAHDGYDVVATASGEEAIQVLEDLSLRAWSDRPVDLVVAEARMSGVGGVYLGEKIRSSGWPIPVILMTSEDDVDSRTASERLHAPMLAKPISMDHLRRLVLSTLAAQPRAVVGHH